MQTDTNHDLRVYESVVDLIASPANPTPLVRLSRRTNPGPPIYLKLEGQNPFGSIKDRAAKYMLRHISLEDGQTLVEPSSGNTGLALAAIANVQGIPIEIAVPERIPEEKKALLRMLGVELWEASDALCPLFPNEGARGLVKSMVESPGLEGRFVSPNQYENELNVRAHYETTGPEIWQQTEGRVELFLAGLGTGGTISGVGRFLKEQNPEIRVVAVEPATAEHNLPGMKRISGLSDDLIPEILDTSVIDEVIAVEDHDAYRMGIDLARREGILVGPTTGAILHAALQVDRGERGLAVVISPDGALKYVSAYTRFLQEEEASREPGLRQAAS